MLVDIHGKIHMTEILSSSHPMHISLTCSNNCRVVFLLLAVICTLDRKYNSTRSLGTLPLSIMSDWPFLSQTVLAVGTKLHVIVARMAVKLDRENIVITGAPPVQPNDDFFWFGNPRSILFLLHLAFFQVSHPY